MGRFLRGVQKAKIPNPFQRSFNSIVWQRHYEGSLPSDPDDERIYRIGLWFDGVLASFRKMAEKSTPADLSFEATIHCLIAMVNRDVAIMHQRVRARFKRQSKRRIKRDGVARLTDLQEATVRLSNGSEVTPDQAITTAVDTVSFLFDNVLKAVPTTDSCAQDISEGDLERAVTMFQQGNVYLILSQLWDKCAYENYDIHQTSNSVIFTIGNHEWSMQLSVSSFRQELASHSLSLSMQSIWRSLSTSERLTLLPKKEVSHIDGDERTQRIVLKSQESHLESTLPHGVSARLSASDQYLQEYFECSFIVSPRISVTLLLDSWEILRSLSACYSRARKEPTTARGILALSRSFSKAEISTFLMQVLGIEEDTANSVIDWLIYTRRREGGLWAHPLIETSLGRLILCDATINHANMLRVVEAWLKESGLPLDGRGATFEHQVIRDIADALNQNTIFRQKIFPRAIAKSSSFDEQIDLVFGFCDKIIIGEIKCQLHPYGSFKIREFYEELQDASKQILRKKKYVEDNISKFRDLAEISDQYEYISIIPIVIHNMRILSGYPIDGVPVCDATFLGKVFSHGITDVMSVLTNGQPTSGIKATYFTSEQQARERIENILKTQLPSRAVERSLIPDIREYLPYSGKMIQEEFYFPRGLLDTVMGR